MPITKVGIKGKTLDWKHISESEPVRPFNNIEDAKLEVAYSREDGPTQNMIHFDFSQAWLRLRWLLVLMKGGLLISPGNPDLEKYCKDIVKAVLCCEVYISITLTISVILCNFGFGSPSRHTQWCDVGHYDHLFGVKTSCPLADKDNIPSIVKLVVIFNLTFPSTWGFFCIFNNSERISHQKHSLTSCVIILVIKYW